MSGHKDGIEKNASWAANITGIPADVVAQIIPALVNSRTMISMSWSLQRAHHGEQPYWSALALSCMLGQIGLPGGGVGYGYASLGGIGGPIGIGKNPAITAGKNAIDSFIPVSRIADMLLKPGSSYSYEGLERTYPHARLVYWAGGNPFHHHQDLNRLREAFTRPQTIIVQDPYFTVTAQHADIVLPATTSLERNDIAANAKSDMMIAMHQAIKPLGKAKSDYEIFTKVSAELNVESEFTEGRGEMDWLRHLYGEAQSSNREKLKFTMPGFDEFWNLGFAEAPSITQHTYLEKFRADPSANALNTATGKILLSSELLREAGYSDCRDTPAWIEPCEWLGSCSSGQFHLISPQPNGRLHSQLESSSVSTQEKLKGREKARISLSDAAQLGVMYGDTLLVSSSRGSCYASAVPDSGVRQGVVVIPTGAWLSIDEQGRDISGNPNILTTDIPASQFSQGCAAHTCIVSIERVDQLESSRSQ